MDALSLSWSRNSWRLTAVQSNVDGRGYVPPLKSFAPVGVMWSMMSLLGPKQTVYSILYLVEVQYL
jgi:hypothetical protein